MYIYSAFIPSRIQLEFYLLSLTEPNILFSILSWYLHNSQGSRLNQSATPNRKSAFLIPTVAKVPILPLTSRTGPYSDMQMRMTWLRSL